MSAGESQLNTPNSPDFMPLAISAEYPFADEPTVQKLAAYLTDNYENPEQSRLYEAQLPVMEDIYKAMATYGPTLKGYVSAPMGAGKTVLITEFARATGLRTLVLVPTKLLIDQTGEQFEEVTNNGELTVGKFFADEKNASEDITISSYASFTGKTKEQSLTLDADDYDVIVLDEAHCALGQETEKCLKLYPDVMQLGWTASPDYSTLKQLRRLLPVEVHEMSIKVAFEAGLISPFSVWIVNTETDMSKVRVTPLNEYNLTDLREALDVETRNQPAVDLYNKRFMGKKAVFFCSDVLHAKRMAVMLRNSGVAAEAIHGRVGFERQRELKRRFESDDSEDSLMVLCNDKIISQGFDVKSIEATFNLVPTLSRVRSKQRSGRALRTDAANPDKHAIIVEFIDQNLPKPPYIFADKAVGGAARLGENHPEVPAEFNIVNAHVITDPQIVDEMAATLAYDRGDHLPAAPKDWVVRAELYRLFEDEYPPACVKAGLERMHREAPELIDPHTGNFSVRSKNRQSPYYSLELAGMLEAYMEKPERPPAHWLTDDQIRVIYDLSRQEFRQALPALTSQQDQYDSGAYVDWPRSGRNRRFYDQNFVRAVTKICGKEYLDGKAPADWPSDNTMTEKYGADVWAQATVKYRNSNREILFANSILIDGLTYYTPDMACAIEEHIAQQTSDNISKIAALPEDKTIAVPHSTPKKALRTTSNIQEQHTDRDRRKLASSMRASNWIIKQAEISARYSNVRPVVPISYLHALRRFRRV